ncbi:Hsp33 family molecular chaperone HslO, partial [Staphylococcus aureus]|uniref:Hsp33 family molecular chaperone HslO n=1 Tax=Staphylococcus aureus TaxID=1280 RepID=UPI001642F7D4
DDYIVKGLGFDGEIRGYGGLRSESVEEGERRDYRWGRGCGGMGRRMRGRGMMGGMLKGDEKLSVSVDGEGGIGGIIGDGNGKGEVGGYV